MLILRISILATTAVWSSNTPSPRACGDDSAPLVIADGGKTTSVIIVSPTAGPIEKLAAADLARYIERMTAARPPIADSPDAISAAMQAAAPRLLVGQEALRVEPTLVAAMARVAKPDAVLRGDAIALRRRGNDVFIAGNHDEAHYYAVSELLHRWGCRWYLPTEFGECVPTSPTLTIRELDYSYASPFEVRHYWLAWNADTTGYSEFLRHNYGNTIGVPSGHILATYTKDLVPAGKTPFHVPISDEATAVHVAKQLVPKFAKGEPIMLGLEDGIYESDSPRDRELKAGLYDKYFQTPALADPFLTFYNTVSRALLQQHPDSPSKIGFLAYSNITIPPQRQIVAERPLVAYLAPIDIDPIHGMDDPRSPPRQEYREMMYRWATVMQRRLVIYDYDQGMLVWRDLPNPSIAAFRQDVKHYRKAGILGVDTESRGAVATSFLNLFIRLQLLWNPDLNVDELLAEFYLRFYGPAAGAMSAYWSAIFNAWSNTIVTEHEHFVAPAIYTPDLLAELRGHLFAAERALPALAPSMSAADRLFADRVRFTRLGFEVLDHYMAMTRAAATEVNYRAAVVAGERGLAARLELAKMNPTFTTRVIGVAAESAATGPAWWPGEVEQFRELAALTDGSKGELLAITPLEWSFRRDPNDTGLASGWAYRDVDLTAWNAQGDRGSVASRSRVAGNWETLRTDLYMQAQGLLMPDGHGYTGHAWYRTALDLSVAQCAGSPHLRFPGLFNECWLYVNGYLVAHRPQGRLWWLNDYRFEWDIDLTGKLRAGPNTITLRVHNPHHFGGIFRRPFLYRPK